MEKRWYYRIDGVTHGPFTASELKTHADAGRFGPEDMVLGDGMNDWRPARKVRDLFPDRAKPPPLTSIRRTGSTTRPNPGKAKEYGDGEDRTSAIRGQVDDERGGRDQDSECPWCERWVSVRDKTCHRCGEAVDALSLEREWRRVRKLRFDCVVTACVLWIGVGVLTICSGLAARDRQDGPVSFILSFVMLFVSIIGVGAWAQYKGRHLAFAALSFPCLPIGLIVLLVLPDNNAALLDRIHVLLFDKAKSAER